jgi:3-oxoacyl-[acyl-carrier protein] reductase
MSASWDFAGKTVVVTGAAQGIGAALARSFLDSGAQVVAADLDANRVREALPKHDRLLPISLDVADPAAVEVAVQQMMDHWGSVDALVNNAGITRDKVSWRLTDEDWSQVLDVHLGGAFNLTRALIPHMRKRQYGRIVNVTSYSGLHGNIGQSNYSAAKAGIVGFSKTVAKEVARFGITVNVISPNAATQMVAAVPAAKKAQLEAAIPLGRFGTPEEIFPAVAFLSSQQAGYITGAVLAVDGGMAM